MLNIMRGYDSHSLIQELGRFRDKTINVIPNNMEKYMAFSVSNKNKADKNKAKVLHELTFIDSLQFMSTSLSQLVDN